MAKRVTINDVAQAAGVSRQTVTRAINDMGEINEQTKQRVLEACQRLGYRPSRFARNLVVRKKTRAMGYLVASFRNPYFTEIAGDLLNTAAERGWHVVMVRRRRRTKRARSTCCQARWTCSSGISARTTTTSSRPAAASRS